MLPCSLLDPIIDRGLNEDLHGGDLTTQACVDLETRAMARAIARNEMVVCGADVFARVFFRVDPGLRVERLVDDGVTCARDTVLWAVEGSARSILMGERTALNFVQRMCGIASLTKRFVEALPSGAHTRIADTRKTTPGLRSLERYAVRCGGGFNHRDALGAGVLIKDNHIEAAGGITRAVQRARRRAPHTLRVEVEVEDFEGLDEAIGAGADVVMLDNFQPDQLARAVEHAAGRVLIEVSGGMSPEVVAQAASAGADVISVGALTHSAPAADISLEIERLGQMPS